MDLGLKGKVAIITGSARIHGKQTAMTLAEEGATVVINDLYPDLVEAAVTEFKARGLHAIGITADVTDYGQVTNMVKRVVDELGTVHILVNNVGIPYGPKGPKSRGWFVEQTPAEWDESLKHTIYCTMNCSSAVLPYMIKQRYGKIINISTVGSLSPIPKHVGYISGKGAINTFTLALAGEVGRYGINVNTVSPGEGGGARDAVVAARRETHPEEYRQREEWKQHIHALTPLGRSATAKDRANVIAFLASDLASFVTGQVWRVDGGFPLMSEYASGSVPEQGR